MNGKYVIAVRDKANTKWFYYSIFNNGDTRIPVLTTEEANAYEFHSEEQVRRVWEKSMKNLEQFIESFCDISTVCAFNRKSIVTVTYEYGLAKKI